MAESLLTLLIAMLLLSAFWQWNIRTNLAMFVHFNRDAEGCWWPRLGYKLSFPAWFTTSYRSSATAGPHSVMAISSEKFVGNKAATTELVSHLLSLVFSLPLDETISAQV
jgi:hypothetical protein